MLNRVLEQSKLATSDGAATRTEKPIGILTRRLAVTTNKGAPKGKEVTAGSAIEAQPSPAIRFILPATTSQPPPRTQIENSLVPGPASDGLTTIFGAGAPGSTMPTPVPVQAVALENFPAPNFPSMFLASGQLSPSSAPLKAVRDVAFALQLTWQSQGRTAEVGVPARPDAIPPKAPDPSHSSQLLDPADEPATSSGEIVGNIKSEIRELAVRTFPEVASGSAPGSSQPAVFRRASARPDPVFQKIPELSAAIAAPFPAASSKKLVEIPISPSGMDTQPQWLSKIPAPVPTKAAPESRSLEPNVPSNEPDAQTEARQPDARQDSEARLDELETSRLLPKATAGTAAPIRPPAAANDSQSRSDENTGQNARSAAGSSDSDGEPPTTQLPLKLSQTQTAHERPSLLVDGVPLGLPSAVSETRAKILATPPSEPPIVSSETEVPRAGPSQTIREVSLRLAVATSAVATSSVDVQLAQRAGKVQVAVRTPDQDLANSLQSNLGQLIGRLEEKGFKTNVWTPVAAQHSGSAVREPSTSSDSQSHSGRPGSQGGQTDSRGGQHESGRRQQGRWKTELEETLLIPSATIEASA
jgi:hypothetical protein